MKFIVLAAVLSLPLAIMGQTINNGSFQVLGSFDVSSGTWSKPMVAVTSDPSGACSNAASMVINTSTGSQKGDISVCVNGAWTLASSSTGGGASSVAQFAPSYGAGGVTFGSCSTGSPCYLAPNNQLDTYTSTPAVTPATGTAADTLFIYGVPGSNTLQVGKGSTNTYGCSGCQVNSGISAPPSNSYAIYKCVVTGGQVVPGGCTPMSTPYSNTGFENGLGTLPVVDSATGALQINNNRNPRIVTSGNDTITNLDCGGMVTYSEASTVNVALPQAGIGNPVTFASGCDIWLLNIGAGSVQITPNSGSPINGSTSIQTLPAASASSPNGMYLVSNGTRFYAASTGGAGGSSPLSSGTISNTITTNMTGSVDAIDASTSTPTGTLDFAGLTNGSQQYKIAVTGSSSSDPNAFIISDVTGGFAPFVVDKSTGLVKMSKGLLQLSTQITPASSSSACVVGNIEADANYIYVCTATNTWKRAMLGTF